MSLFIENGCNNKISTKYLKLIFYHHYMKYISLNLFKTYIHTNKVLAFLAMVRYLFLPYVLDVPYRNLHIVPFLHAYAAWQKNTALENKVRPSSSVSTKKKDTICKLQYGTSSTYQTFSQFSDIRVKTVKNDFCTIILIDLWSFRWNLKNKQFLIITLSKSILFDFFIKIQKVTLGMFYS